MSKIVSEWNVQYDVMEGIFLVHFCYSWFGTGAAYMKIETENPHLVEHKFINIETYAFQCPKTEEIFLYIKIARKKIRSCKQTVNYVVFFLKKLYTFGYFTSFRFAFRRLFILHSWILFALSYILYVQIITLYEAIICLL